MLSLSQKLSQQQKLSPQQIQYQKLLQLNTLALEQRIKTELEINPILEEEMELNKEEEKEKDDEVEEVSDPDNEEFELEDYMNDDDFDHERVNRSNDEETFQPLAPSRSTLYEHLLSQLRLLDLSDDMAMLGEEIIGNLNSDGYLKRGFDDLLEELELFEHVIIDRDKAEDLLHTIQHFDPIGIASRNLQECLLIQLRASQDADKYFQFLAQKMLEEHYDDFTKRRFEVLKQKMNLTDDSLKKTVELIQNLNPKPGEGNLETAELNQINPDFLIEKVDDNFIITLNDKSMPSVTINRQYLEMFDSIFNRQY